jgi:hypothetical protein
VTLYGLGSNLIGGDSTAAGTELVLRSILQSPFFLYRIEHSTTVKNGVIPLDGYEVATRLSYMLWNTMPDEDLMAAAAAGELTTATGVAKAAARMLQDPRGEQGIASFHRQLFRVAGYVNIAKNAKVFPQFSPTMSTAMAAEHDAFVRETVISNKGGLLELLTAPYTFANKETAPVYGLTGSFTSDMKRVELDPQRRAGILTQLGFLAVNATAAASDPIHRGVFTNLNILCATLPPPPGNVPALPADDGVMTTREQVNKHTGPGTCGAGCHGTFINPIGFAFEHYDALGGWRDSDHGKPIDAAAKYDFDDGTISYNGARELMDTIVKRDDVHACYARKWANFALGRAITGDDAGLLAALGAKSKAGGGVRELLVKLSQSKTFLARSMNEVSP